MPIFELQDPKTGKVYEVDAPDEQTAAKAFAPQQSSQASQGAPGATIPPTPGTPQGAAFDPSVTKALAGDITSGVVEAGARLAGGAKQLAGNARDFYRAVVEGKPYITADKQDPVTGQTIRGTFSPDSKGYEATAQELLRQQVDALDAKENGVDPGIRGAVAAAGEIAPLAIAPEYALPRATTVIGGAMKNSVSGLLGSLFTFEGNNNNGTDTAIAISASPAIGLIQSLPPALLNLVGRHLTKVAGPGSRSGEALASARKALPGVDYTLAQVTGIPELKSLERLSYDTTLIKFYADQNDKLVKNFRDVMTTPASTTNTLDELFARTKTSAEQGLSAMRSNASQMWDAGMAKASAIDQHVIGGVRVPVQNFRQRFDIERQIMNDPLANLQKDPIAQRTLRRLADTLYDPVNGRPRDLTAQQMASLLKGLTAVQREGSPAAKAFATRMRGSLETDIDLLKDTPAAHANKAMETILDTRAAYKTAMEQHAALANSTAYKLMGVGDDVKEVSGADLLGKFKAFDPSRQRSVQRYLQTNAPDMLATMKNEAVNDIVRRSGRIQAAADSTYDADRFVEAMFDPKTGDEIRTLGLWNKEELEKLDGVRNSVRVIYNNRPKLGSAGTQIKPEDIAPNLVSRSGIFIARQATRILMSSKASDLFTNPQVSKLLFKINRSTTGSPSNLAARGALLELLQTEYPDEQQQQQQQPPQGQQPQW